MEAAQTYVGGTVIVSGTAGQVGTAPDAGVLAAMDAGGKRAEHQPLLTGEAYRWQPEKAPDGPLSIIVSRSDRRVIVLRNGVEIGRARALVAGGDTATHVYAYSGIVNGERIWTVAGVPGRAGVASGPVRPWAREGIDMPATFLAQIRAALTPGATILVTEAKVLPANSGKQMTVLASD